MELLSGMDLQVMVDRHGPLAPARVIHFLRQACLSLAEAHQLGLVHRDVKPSNLFVTRLGLEWDFLKVLDFGVVKLEAGPDGAGPALTKPDIPLGTPAYMAPEGVEGGNVLTARSDVYSLGCTAFFLLTGELLFHRGSLFQMASAHVHDPPRAPSEVHGEPIPPGLDALVLRCVAKRPQDRPADAAALLAELDPLARAHPWSAAAATEWWRSMQPPAIP
jgi:serine/threonine protein kinase